MLKRGQENVTLRTVKYFSFNQVLPVPAGGNQQKQRLSVRPSLAGHTVFSDAV